MRGLQQLCPLESSTSKFMKKFFYLLNPTTTTCKSKYLKTAIVFQISHAGQNPIKCAFQKKKDGVISMKTT